ncbi:M67 family metallopeptidase [Sneathiella limimaris]|uniref:M67 family metallopeptidase n=1 Tax=Sneathiella limimaris TaxID=1964213 RepID=UPI00146F30BD|nr:M67 family metallopeptidase [Sneathiella limimaris]
MDVNLTKKHFDCLRTHSIECYPEEACALIIGARVDDAIKVTDVVIAENVAANKERFFEVDPATRIRLEKQYRGQSCGVIGVFHSHPNGEARPSATDEKMVIERELFWLVASITQSGDFQLKGYIPGSTEGFEPVNLVIEGNVENE